MASDDDYDLREEIGGGLGTALLAVDRTLDVASPSRWLSQAEAQQLGADLLDRPDRDPRGGDDPSGRGALDVFLVDGRAVLGDFGVALPSRRDDATDRCMGKPRRDAAAAAVLEPPTPADRIGRATGLEGAPMGQALDELEWERWLTSDVCGYSFVAPLTRVRYRVIARAWAISGSVPCTRMRSKQEITSRRTGSYRSVSIGVGEEWFGNTISAPFNAPSSRACLVPATPVRESRCARHAV